MHFHMFWKNKFLFDLIWIVYLYLVHTLRLLFFLQWWLLKNSSQINKTRRICLANSFLKTTKRIHRTKIAFYFKKKKLFCFLHACLARTWAFWIVFWTNKFCFWPIWWVSIGRFCFLCWHQLFCKTQMFLHVE